MPKVELLEDAITRMASFTEKLDDKLILLRLAEIFAKWNVQDVRDLENFLRD